jgi:hypothetical protein
MPVSAESVAGPRRVAAYLRELRPVLSAPRLARRDWIRDVGLLIEEARTGDPITLSRTAGQYGHNGITIFREARRRLSDLDPPPECQALHQAIGEWIGQHVEACEVLIRISDQRTLRPLRDVQERLAEGRAWAGRFNGEYLTVVEDLRNRVALALGRDIGRRTSSNLARRLGRLLRPFSTNERR